MGCEDPRGLPHGGPDAMTDARPIHRVYVDGFWIDQYRSDQRSVRGASSQATGYVTVAERTPTAAEFPGAPPENLVAGSVVFTPPAEPVPLDNHYQWWSYVHGSELASSARARQQYRRPRQLPGRARCLRRCRGLRPLGRQAAADRGRVGIRRPRRHGRRALFLGRRVSPRRQMDGQHLARAVPRPQYGRTTDSPALPPSASSRPMAMASSTWPATSGNGAPTGIAPILIRWRRRRTWSAIRRGPRAASTPPSPASPSACIRGGSFLCTEEYCTRYMIGTRGKGEVSSGSNHLGFRCVKVGTLERHPTHDSRTRRKLHGRSRPNRTTTLSCAVATPIMSPAAWAWSLPRRPEG